MEKFLFVCILNAMGISLSKTGADTHHLAAISRVNGLILQLLQTA